VVALHGTPGSRLHLVPGAAAARAAGVRLLVPDRPGYGLSTFQPGRSLTGWVDDLAELLDHLQIERLAVLGVSGGGPYAAACARLMPARVTAAAIVSGVAPLVVPGSEAGMLPADRLLIRLGRRSEALIRPLCLAQASFGRHRPERALDMMATALSPSDQAVLRRPEIRAAFVADLSTCSPTTGAATAQEYALLAHAWGFDLEGIEVPVHLWHGDVDREVPLAQARRQAAAIPGAVLHECAGAGHLLLVDQLDDILRLLSRYS